jgi:hypothetical protein
LAAFPSPRECRVLHRLVLLARLMAYQRKGHDEIAAVLDDADYLAQEMAASAGLQPTFEERLEGLAEGKPHYAGILEEYRSQGT